MTIALTPRRRPVPLSPGGFTLIELLVVIAVIAIIAAILFPVFSKARDKARQAACMSNEKQIGLAILQYVQDNNERYPRAVNNASPSDKLVVLATPAVVGDNAFLDPGPTGVRPSGFLLSYMKSEQIWRCPQDPVTYDSSVLNANGSGSIANASSYHLSLYLTGTQVDPNTETTSGDGLPLSEVPRPAQTILARDGDSNDGTNVRNSTTVGGALVGEQFYTRHSDHTQGNRHAGWGNYLMADGHVKTLSPDAVSPMQADDDPQHPCPSCPDKVNSNAQAFWNILP